MLGLPQVSVLFSLGPPRVHVLCGPNTSPLQSRWVTAKFCPPPSPEVSTSPSPSTDSGPSFLSPEQPQSFIPFPDEGGDASECPWSTPKPADAPVPPKTPVGSKIPMGYCHELSITQVLLVVVLSHPQTCDLGFVNVLMVSQLFFSSLLSTFPWLCHASSFVSSPLVYKCNYLGCTSLCFTISIIFP